MASVGVVGSNAHELQHAFMHMCKGAASCYHITDGQLHGPAPDILVVPEATPALAELIPRMNRENYLVVNADDKGIFPYLQSRPARIITYGFNNKACITASSVTDDALHVCIQRAFVALDGGMRELQEFAAPGAMSVSAEAALGAAAVWAVCGNM